MFASTPAPAGSCPSPSGPCSTASAAGEAGRAFVASLGPPLPDDAAWEVEPPAPPPPEAKRIRRAVRYRDRGASRA